MRSKRPILLIEDDRVDAMTVKRALRDIHVNNRLEIVKNGEEALMFLRSPGAEMPCLMLLDLNMPRMNGIEFLKLAKQDDKIRRIPVIVITTSSEEQDKLNSFNLGVAGYMIKPIDYPKFVESLKTIDLYWSVSEIIEEK